MYALELELSPLLRAIPGAIPGERIVALEFIPANTLLASISTAALLSLKTTSFPARLLAILLHHPPPFTLALVLLHETILPHSPWSGYIRSLPPNLVPVAALWPPEARRWIHGTQLATLVDNNDMLRDFHDRHVIPLFSHVHPVHPPPSLDSFRYCYSLVSSRAFTVSAYHGLALCPFADMLDHANPISEDHAGPYNNVDFRSDYWVCSTCGMVDDCEHDEDDASTTERRSDRRSAATCEIVSILPILPGEEIFNNYGRLDNSALLTHYGFALEDNEFDRITWTASEVLLEFDIEWSESAERLSALIESWPSGPGEEGENALVLGCPTKPSGDSPTDSSQLFINSDAKISRPLWILLALVVNPPNRTASLSAVCASLLELDTHQTSIFGGLESKSNATIRATSRDLAGAIRWLCRRRVEASCAPELSVDDILSLAQEEQTIEVKLAMEFLAAERARLECVESLFSSLIVE